MNVIEEKYNWAYPLTRRARTTLLVLHHEAGSGSTAQQIHNYHRYTNGWAGIAYHYYVRKDGTIYRGRPENTIGGHCLGYNSTSIGICFEGNFENETMGQAQINAGWELIADILRRYPGISVRRHKDLNQTACPGRNFPFDTLTGAENPQEDEMPTQEEFNHMMDTWLAQRNAAYEPKWSMDAGSYGRAKAKGIMDGTRAEAFVKRDELAAILDRLKLL